MSKENSAIDKECDRALSRLTSGDKSALSVIYDHYGKLMMSVAYAIVESYADAEDVLQESMIDLVRYAYSYKSGSKPRAYVLAIVRHKAIDLVRKRQLPSSLEESEDMGVNDEHLNTFEVLDMLRLLSYEERQVTVLHLYAGLTHRQIGKILGISTSSSEKKYQRALKKLKNFYES